MEEAIWFSFDDLKLMSALKLTEEEDDIGLSILGNIYDEEKDENIPCELLIHKHIFYTILEEWIEYKVGYYESDGMMAGVGGVYITEFEEVNEVEDVRSFICYNYSIHMERGWDLEKEK